MNNKNHNPFPMHSFNFRLLYENYPLEGY